MKLDIRAFFFNAKTDYLPYYKNYIINIDKSEKIDSILPLIKEQNKDFSYPEKKCYFRLNSFVTDGSESIDDIVNRFGNELTIEAVSKYRSTNGLIINDDDFYESFKLLEPFCNDEDKEYYNNLYGLHYASATFEYNKNYIGDAILILASKLLFNKHPQRDEIIEAISCDNGLWEAEYENNMLTPHNYYDTFNLLKSIAKPIKDKNKVSGFFARGYKNIELSSDGIGVAYYYGINNNDFFNFPQNALDKGYYEVNYSHCNKSCGIDLFSTNEELALKKAGRVLADAYDNGAEILIAKKRYIDYFKANIGKIEKVANRNILINLEDIDSFEF